jgi:hypothetical protein
VFFFTLRSLFLMNKQQGCMQNQSQGPHLAQTAESFYYHRMKVASLCNTKFIYVPALRKTVNPQGNTYLQSGIGIHFTGVAKIHRAVLSIYITCFNFTKLCLLPLTYLYNSYDFYDKNRLFP